MSTKSSLGFTLIETVVAIALLLTFVVGSLSSHTLATNAVTVNQRRSQANLLARQALEAVHSLRATAYPSLSPGIFHPVLTPSGWALNSGSQILGDFPRAVTLSPAHRALACDTPVCQLVTGGGVLDLGTYYVTVSITWASGGQTEQLSLDSLITHWR